MENLNFVEEQLETEKINKLIFLYSVPSVIGMLINSLYNIIDQIFIGYKIGILGTATTNIAFPITTICTAISMLIGIGSASNLNLLLGKKEHEKAGNVIGNAISLMILSGGLFSCFTLFFIEPILSIFGSTEILSAFAKTYIRIISFGIPFSIIASSGSQIIRADGSPIYSMICIIIGALLNIILDALLLFGLNLGIEGVAWATVISQFISSLLVLFHFKKFKTFKLQPKYFRLKIWIIKKIASLGAGACINQLCITVFQIVLNNSLVYYGANSIYGSEIPLASVGVITKINTILTALISGTSQGCQPIFSYNYGAQKYERLYETIKKAFFIVIGIGILAEIIFQVFPVQLVSLFGNGGDEYFEFSTKYLRIFMMMTFINGIQFLAGNFLSSIGKATKGIIAIILKQLVFLIPLLLILPHFWGINGIMYSGPIADAATAVAMLFLLYSELKN